MASRFRLLGPAVKDRRAYEVFSALGDPRRVFMFELLLRQEGHCVSDIAEECAISIPAASQQLKILERAGLIVARRAGKQVCFEVNRRNPLARRVVAFLSS